MAIHNPQFRAKLRHFLEEVGSRAVLDTLVEVLDECASNATSPWRIREFRRAEIEVNEVLRKISVPERITASGKD